MKKRRLQIVVASGLFGIVVWLSVSMSEQFQITVPVPLTIENIPEGWAIRTAVPRALQVRLRGDGWRLAALLLGPDLRLDFPLNSLPAGNRALSFADVADRISLRPGVQLVDMKPDSVFLGLDRFVRKKIPVVLDCVVSFRDGYGQVGTIAVEPESVTIGGAESVLATIDSWKTQKTVFEGLKNPVEADVPLAASNTYLVSLSVPTIRVRISVQPFAEKVFSGLPVEIYAVPPNREVILIPPKIDAVVRGGIRQLSNLSSNDFRVSVDYGKILSDTTGTVDAEIGAPGGVQVVSRRPEHLQYIVRKRL